MKVATRGDGTESDVVATLLSHLLSVARASGHGPHSLKCVQQPALGGEGGERSEPGEGVARGI
jgi:hypothetical protein